MERNRDVSFGATKAQIAIYTVFFYVPRDRSFGGAAVAAETQRSVAFSRARRFVVSFARNSGKA